MTGFGQESRAELENLRKPENIRKSSPVLVGAGEIFEAFQSLCEQGANGSAAVDIDNMETLFCIVEMAREAGISFHLPFSRQASSSGERTVSSDDLYDNISLWLWKIYHSCPPLSHPKYRRCDCVDPSAYEGFLEFLCETHLSQRVTVLTTNYDMIFEYYAWAMGQGSTYPLIEGVHYTPLQVGPAPCETFVGSDKRVPDCPLVCKLHGSVNFFERGAFGVPVLGICTDIAKAGDVIGESFINPYRDAASRVPQAKLGKCHALVALDTIWVLREKYGAGLFPAIVPPTYAKLQGKPWLRPTWNCAFRAIQDARVLIFIGYSMPATDGFMRAMLQGAIASRNKPGPEIFVINPFTEESKEEPYTTIFPVLKEKRETNIVDKKFAVAWKIGAIQEILDKYQA